MPSRCRSVGKMSSRRKIAKIAVTSPTASTKQPRTLKSLSTTGSPLLDLIPEIRYNIWRFVLSTDGATNGLMAKGHPKTVNRKWRGDKKMFKWVICHECDSHWKKELQEKLRTKYDVSFLTVCKQMYVEIQPLLYNIQPIRFCSYDHLIHYIKSDQINWKIFRMVKVVEFGAWDFLDGKRKAIKEGVKYGDEVPSTKDDSHNAYAQGCVFREFMEEWKGDWEIDEEGEGGSEHIEPLVRCIRKSK